MSSFQNSCTGVSQHWALSARQLLLFTIVEVFEATLDLENSDNEFFHKQTIGICRFKPSKIVSLSIKRRPKSIFFVLISTLMDSFLL